MKSGGRKDAAAGLLISPERLAAGDYVVFDCRFDLSDPLAGRRLYLEAHIPGARFADLEADLSSQPGRGGRHPLPDRATLAAKLGSWGVGRDTRVVCYDQNTGAFAGRLWWLLRWLGHSRVAVLDGGLDAWRAAGMSVTAAVPGPAPQDFEVRAPLVRIAPVPCVSALSRPDSASGKGTKLLDARDAARFRGEVEPIDRVAGHIPGAISAPFTDNLEDGRFADPAALGRRFAALGVAREDELVCCCGSGVTATHNILALLLAGYPEPALYPGGWSEWLTDPARPVATG